ncbi:MAG: hypothetical protein M0Z44_08260 [Gammaproteobacteria bacterium]|nr:hypothetical protein [Gammaproteobacteria bacterium]
MDLEKSQAHPLTTSEIDPGAPWLTRKEKYGERGHAGSYTRAPRDDIGLRALVLVVELHRAGVLSESRCLRALGITRRQLRALCDRVAAGGEVAAEMLFPNAAPRSDADEFKVA